MPGLTDVPPAATLRAPGSARAGWRLAGRGDAQMIRMLRVAVTALLLNTALGGAHPGTAVAATPIPAISQLAAGGAHACALTSAGTVYCWGWDGHNQLGDGTNWSSGTPLKVAGLAGVRQIDAGDQFTCAVIDDGTVRCWGNGMTGQLGDGLTHESSTPVLVQGVSHAVEVAAGSGFACARTDAGAVWCWGLDDVGQLGQLTVTGATHSTAIAVSLTSWAIDLTAGSAHACAVVWSGDVKCWGHNDAGQAGAAPSTSRAPGVVAGLGSVVRVDAGAASTCALMVDSSARCWGSGANGRLGNGDTATSAAPVIVSGLLGATSLAVGFDHACVSIVDGSAKCWGAYVSGQLGNGTGFLDGADATTPVAVTGATGFVSMVAGTFFTCALDGVSQVSCWGSSVDGQTATGNPLPEGPTDMYITLSTPYAARWDVTPPMATLPAAIPQVGLALVGTAVPMAVTATVTDPAKSGATPITVSGPGRSRFYLSSNGGTSWVAKAAAFPAERLPGTRFSAATTVTVNIPTTGTARLSVTPVDRTGLAGAARTGATFTARLVQDTSTQVHYAGTWAKTAGSTCSGGSTHTTSKTGAGATFTFTGRGVALVSSVGPDRGILKVYVNGLLAKTVNLSAPGARQRTIAWAMAWSTSATRTVRIVASLAAGTRADLDAFVVIR